MMGRTLLNLVSLLSMSLLGTGTVGEEPQAEKSDAKGIALFENQIKPVLVNQCYECHSRTGEKVEGGLELDSPAGLMRGGDSGPVLVSHQVERSTRAIRRLLPSRRSTPLPSNRRALSEARQTMGARSCPARSRRHGLVGKASLLTTQRSAT
jgi:hypothetical protein